MEFTILQPYVTLRYIMAIVDEPSIPAGSIFEYMGNDLAKLSPQWKLCNGTLFSNDPSICSKIAELSSNCLTPNLTGRFVIGEDDQSLMFPKYIFGSIGGQESVSLNSTHLPLHSHFATLFSNFSGSQQLPEGNYFGSNLFIYSPNNDSFLDILSEEGNNQPISLFAPSFSVNFVITTIPLKFIYESGIIINSASDEDNNTLFLKMNGYSFNSADYPFLNSTISPSFVSNNSFFLPNTQGRSFMGSSTLFPLGSILGQESHILTYGQMPKHRHMLFSSNQLASESQITQTYSVYLAITTQPIYVDRFTDNAYGRSSSFRWKPTF
eukprot:TRINITY_DN767_c0_g1_i1.p1 TRINITY_DN767_c0_g1~~TRINITY_DN767_c0_g1_i1.p1  ORF type:complete len:324 (+),score=38.15 TRINITY_DN767_c0_g1_i1:546-1517(+)